MKRVLFAFLLCGIAFCATSIKADQDCVYLITVYHEGYAGGPECGYSYHWRSGHFEHYGCTTSYMTYYSNYNCTCDAW